MRPGIPLLYGLVVAAGVAYYPDVRTHQQIDARALMLARCVVARIDADPAHAGIEQARRTCRRWQRILSQSHRACVDEWAAILQQPWSTIRRVLLEESERGNRLRQNSPFCGILSNRERWKLLKEFATHDARAA